MFESIGDTAILPETEAVAEKSSVDQRKLASLISTHAPHDGSFELCIPGLCVTRSSQTNTESVHAVARPVLCIIAQGAKTVMLGQEILDYDSSRMLVFSVDLPVAGRITLADYSAPYLAFRLDLDPHRISDLVLRIGPNSLPAFESGRGVYVSEADAGVINAAARLVELAAHPDDAELLAPLVIDEILIRLLRSTVGGRVAQIGIANSSMHRIARAVSWLRANFSQPMKVEELAELAHMSVSSFHQHFKSATSMSPLHYQKILRLQEARRLMLSTLADAGTAGREVGYVSASQFSRDYGRFFGSAPARDVARLREKGLTIADVFR
jgi:AraC-like DNA-binding protein